MPSYNAMDGTYSNVQGLTMHRNDGRVTDVSNPLYMSCMTSTIFTVSRARAEPASCAALLATAGVRARAESDAQHDRVRTYEPRTSSYSTYSVVQWYGSTSLYKALYKYDRTSSYSCTSSYSTSSYVASS